MFIDPPEGCKGSPTNLNNVITYDISEAPNQIEFITLSAHVRFFWTFETNEAALEGMAYIKELRDRGEGLNIDEANRFFRGSNRKNSSMNW